MAASPYSPNQQYDVFWNAAVAQHTFDQLHPESRGEVFMRAMNLLSEHNLSTEENLAGYEDLVTTLNEDCGFSVLPKPPRHVGPIVFWCIVGAVLRSMNISPNVGRVPSPSWKPPVSLEAIIQTSLEPDEAACQRALDVESQHVVHV